MTLTLRSATAKELPAVARMALELVEDEGASTSRTLADVERRFAGWMAEGWSLDLLLDGGELAGYALYQFRPDEYYPEQVITYLRDFLIERQKRGQGTGRLAFDLLVRERFPAGKTVVLEVLSANISGRRFWDALGFQPFSTTMTLRLPPR